MSAIEKILLIDDDQDDQDFFLDAIADVRRTLTCHLANNGIVALEKLKTKELKDVQLILLDINMPPMDGWETLEKLKAGYAHIPVIMYSTSIIQTDAARAIELGAAGYIPKPSGFKELVSLIRIIASTSEERASTIAAEYRTQNPKTLLN